MTAGADSPGDKTWRSKANLQVVFMQELALISLLTESSQPMFTHKVVERMRDLMFVWTGIAEWAVAFPEGFAVLAARI